MDTKFPDRILPPFAVAMLLKFYDVKTDPQQLNWFLTSVGGISPGSVAFLPLRLSCKRLL